VLDTLPSLVVAVEYQAQSTTSITGKKYKQAT